jgi:hypothetical protein
MAAACCHGAGLVLATAAGIVVTVALHYLEVHRCSLLDLDGPGGLLGLVVCLL